MLNIITDSLLALLYPQACGSCGDISERAREGVSCANCWQNSRLFTGAETICAKCGDLLRETPSHTDAYCHQCTDHHYDLARAAGVYEHGLAATVIQLKQTPRISRSAKYLLTSAFDSAPFEDVSLIMPVPLSKHRLLERGFNQAGVLARMVARHAGIEFREDILLRKIHTIVHRAAMDKKARDMTVKNAFEVTDAEAVKNRNIVLIDDVFTSGATTSYCAKALKRKGAGKVYVFTLARAVTSA